MPTCLIKRLPEHADVVLRLSRAWDEASLGPPLPLFTTLSTAEMQLERRVAQCPRARSSRLAVA